MEADLNLPWKVAPLEVRKYYGTKILDSQGEEVMSVWDHDAWGENLPSRREIEKWGPSFTMEKWNDYICDTHYESARDLAYAECVVERINN
jgi:hypothetical protein